MSSLQLALENFHLLRPLWLLLVPVAILLCWLMRRHVALAAMLPEGVASHLGNALTVGDRSYRRFYAVDGVALFVILAAIGASGPTWSRIPTPFVAETAPLAIALEVSKSMEQPDVPPNRLERAKQKILDVVASRAGARTALIAYAGSAHRVAPLTEDPEVLKPFLEGLSPDVMPKEGQDATAALALAVEALSTEAVPGAILFVIDGLDPGDVPAFEDQAAQGGPQVVFLKVGSDVDADVDAISGARTVDLTVDESDIVMIGRLVASAYNEAMLQDDRQRWNDRGWMLAWPAALLAAIWFRRGWTMKWIFLLTAFGLTSMPVQNARAADIASWFFTPDQRGQLAFNDKRFADAAKHFQDPMWRGYALYRAGRYDEAADLFGRLDTAEAAFAQGMAHIKSRGYRPAIQAFETTLERDPANAAAARNLDIARAILDYVESTREQSSTEEGTLGADDVVFDNEADRGSETVITGPTEAKVQSAEQWMRAVDTKTADFLRLRFAQELNQERPE